MRTNDNTILITGGGSDMGLALAEAFLHAGNDVILCGRSQARLDAALRRLPALRTFTCDIAEASDRRRLYENIREYEPRMNVLVNMAGKGGVLDLVHNEDPVRITAAELNVDLQAPILLTMQFLHHLLEQPQAAVINISTVLAYMPRATYPAYSAASAGLHSFSKSLRHQLCGTPVEVIEVVPPASSAGGFNGVPPGVNPQALAEAVLEGMGKGKTEIRIGQARVLYHIARLMPGVAFRMMNNLER